MTGAVPAGAPTAPAPGRPLLLVANGNPLSGDAAAAAARLRDRIRGAAGTAPELVATEFAGHAGEVARRWAADHPDGAIVGIGGDGTLNEIAEAILALPGDRRPSLAVYPAGNANDQFRSWTSARTPPLELVGGGADPAVPVDVIELSWSDPATGAGGRRHALSYASVGLLARAAAIVNTRRRTRWSDARILPAALLRLRPVHLAVDGADRTLDSLSWHIVRPMAKYLRIASNSRRDDGLMEVVAVRHPPVLARLRLLWLAARALVGLGRRPQVREMSFHWPAGGLVQVDGETFEVPAGSDVAVRCRPGALRMTCCDVEPPRRTGAEGPGKVGKFGPGAAGTDP